MGARGGVPSFVWVLLGIVLLGMMGTCGTCVYLGVRASEEPSGVVYASQLPEATLRKAASRAGLEPGDELLVYYDGSISLDMSQLALMTTERVITAARSKRASMRLADIVSIDHHVEALNGDMIDLASAGGPKA